MQPSPRAETSSPLFPNLRFCIVSPPITGLGPARRHPNATPGLYFARSAPPTRGFRSFGAAPLERRDSAELLLVELNGIETSRCRFARRDAPRATLGGGPAWGPPY